MTVNGIVTDLVGSTVYVHKRIDHNNYYGIIRSIFMMNFQLQAIIQNVCDESQLYEVPLLNCRVVDQQEWEREVR